METDPVDDWEEEEVQQEPQKPVFAKKKTQPPIPQKKQSKTPLRASRGADEKFTFRSSMEDFQQKSAVTERQLDIDLRPGNMLVSEDLRTEGVVYKKKKQVLIKRLLQAMPKKNSIVVAREVLDMPVAFRKSPFPRDV